MNDSVPRQIIHALFSFRGRIGRFAFLGYSLLAVVWFYGLVIFSISTAGNDRSATVSAISSVAFLLALPALWSFVALVSKRLHDMNRSAWHCVWLFALWLICLIGDLLPSPLSIIADIASVATAIWLLAMPGNPAPNAHDSGGTVLESP